MSVRYCPACYGRLVYCHKHKTHHCDCSWNARHPTLKELKEQKQDGRSGGVKLKYHGTSSSAFWKDVQATQDVDDEFGVLTSMAIALGKLEFAVSKIIAKRQEKLKRKKRSRG